MFIRSKLPNRRRSSTKLIIRVKTGASPNLLLFYMDDVAGADRLGQTARIRLAVNEKFLEKYRMGFIQHPDIFQKFIRAG
jgi:hypothetical protein